MACSVSHVLITAKSAWTKLTVRRVLKATISTIIKHALAVQTPAKMVNVINPMALACMVVSMDIRESNVRPNAHLIAYNVTCKTLKLAFCVLLDFMVITVISAVSNARKASKYKRAMKATELVNMVVMMVTGVRCVQNNVQIGARVLVAMKLLEPVSLDVALRIMDSSVSMNVALTAPKFQFPHDFATN